ncbi:Do family serine endopeptidase [Pararhodobacter zhoushanensis]|uniref:Do family serine endopeptidase n=1 Tax=Pararhodobacter zhoushanensis TaxID=2479545 RepID=UPI000F8D84B1
MTHHQAGAASALALARPTPGWVALRWFNLLGMVLLVAAMALPLHAQDRPVSFADLADLVSPAVVNITTSTTVAASLDRTRPQLPDGAPFQDFFNDFFNQDGRQQPRPRQSQALGSGFVISADGYIVTNNHVIEGADEIEIEFRDGTRLDATLVGTDSATDIALLKVEADHDLPFVSFGDSESARVGDWVLAVGNPLGQGFSVSAGIVSARGRALQGNYDDYIQTDAAINRGNSGGPLFNMNGEVIGVNTAILSPNGGSIGIGFAMSSHVVERVVFQLQEFGETRRGWLGVRIQDVSGDVAEALGLTAARGALVTEVMDGPSKAAGVESGDVILSFDGVEVADTRELVRRVADAGVGREVDVVVFRDGAEQTLQVTLAQRDEEQLTQTAAGAQPQSPDVSQVLGLELTALTDQMREQMGLAPGTTGVVIGAVEPGSDAESKGLRAGDIITEAGQQPVTSVEDFHARLDAAREAGRRTLLLMIRSGGDPRFVALSVD